VAIRAKTQQIGCSTDADSGLGRDDRPMNEEAKFDWPDGA
jgi:hypothetical protein